MAFFTFQNPGAEVLIGAAEDDTFIGSNANFGAGDRAIGNGGRDRLEYFADTTLTASGPIANARLFSGFVLQTVEVFSATNDSALTLIFDMSSSTYLRAGSATATSDIDTLEVENSTNSVVFDQVGPVFGAANPLARLLLDRQTSAATSNVTLGYAAGLLNGANDVVNVELQATNAGIVTIGSSTATLGAVTNTGVETVNLAVTSGASVVQQLNTDLTNLTISASPNFAAGDGFTINAALNTTVRNITSNFQGNVTLSWANNAAAVTYTGSQTGTGANRLTAGAGNDSITTFAGNDVIDGGAGNDTINAGEGNNVVRTGAGTNSVTTGAGADTIYSTGTDTINSGEGADVISLIGSTRATLNAGGGNDFVDGTGGNFDASLGAAFDTLNMGVNDFDILAVDAGTVDAQYRQVTSLDAVAIATAGTTTLQGNAIGVGGTSNAQAAGINSVYLISGSAGNDVLNAGTFTSALTVVSHSSNAALIQTDADGRATSVAGRFNNFGAGGGSDTVTTGSASDQFFFRGDNNLDNSDRINGGGQAGNTADALYLNGNTTITAAAAGAGAFTNVEFIALESARTGIYRANPAANATGNIYNLTLTNANAPSAGQRITIAGNDLQSVGAAIIGLNGPSGGVLTTSENAVINAGAVTAYGLNITTGNGFDTITTSQFGDFVQTQGGDDVITDGGAGNDVIDPGLGNDVVFLTAGNNTVGDIGGSNTVSLGTGNDTVAFLGTGANVGTDTVIAGVNLTNQDVLVDNGGIDSIQVFGRNYVDGNFSGVVRGFEILQVGGLFNFQLGQAAQSAGFRTIVAFDGAASTIDAGQMTTAIRVDLGNGQAAAGNDVVTLSNIAALATAQSSVTLFNDTPTFAPGVTLDFIGGGDVVTDANDLTANANLVVAGNGDQQVIGGTGTDVLRVSGAQLTAADQFRGGAGLDVVQLNNAAGVVNATVNLTLVTSVELYQFTSNNIAGVVNDTANHTLRFGNAGAATVTTLTPVTVDASRLTDGLDTTTVSIDVSMQDADFQFNILGGANATTVAKENVGFNNNLNFQGGTGIDTLRINGGDLGSTTRFNGGSNLTDVIVQTGGQITDDGFVSVREVEILQGVDGIAPVQATLGAQAGLSGLRSVRGTSGNDVVFFDAAFGGQFRGLAQNAGLNNQFTVDLGTGGDDNINGRATDVAFNFISSNAALTGADILQGGTTANDVLTISATGNSASVLTGLAGVETINVTLPNNSGFGTTITTVTLGTGAVDGGVLTVNATDFGGTPTVPAGFNDFRLNGGAVTAQLRVNSGSGFDTIITGSGNDVVNAGNGDDRVSTGAGNDTVNAGIGIDLVDGGTGDDVLNGDGDNDILLGGVGRDTINGGDGNDLIRGWVDSDVFAVGAATPADEIDIINGGAGNDLIEGGAGGDTLTGGAGVDVFLYRNRSDSNLTTGGRDVITDFVSGTDVIDALSVREALATYGNGAQVRFAGNATSFGDSQSLIRELDGILDVVFQQNAGTDASGNSFGILWFDLNDDGALNANDLQIQIAGPTGFVANGFAGLQAADVLAGLTTGQGNYTTFDAQFAGAFPIV